MAEWESTGDDRGRQRFRNLLPEGSDSPPSFIPDTTCLETLRAGAGRLSMDDAEDRLTVLRPA